MEELFKLKAQIASGRQSAVVSRDRQTEFLPALSIALTFPDYPIGEGSTPDGMRRSRRFLAASLDPIQVILECRQCLPSVVEQPE